MRLRRNVPNPKKIARFPNEPPPGSWRDLGQKMFCAIRQVWRDWQISSGRVKITPWKLPVLQYNVNAAFCFDAARRAQKPAA